MGAEESKELVRGFAAALSRGDPNDAARRFHRSYRSNTWGGDLIETWSRMQEIQRLGDLTDVEEISRELIAEGDLVVLRRHLRAKHSGPLLGVPASGRSVEFHSLEMWRVQDGKLVEHWGGIQEARRLFEQLSS